MNGWIIAAAVVVVVVPVAVLAYSMCRVASDADDAMDEWDAFWDWSDAEEDRD